MWWSCADLVQVNTGHVVVAEVVALAQQSTGEGHFGQECGEHRAFDAAACLPVLDAQVDELVFGQEAVA